MSNSFQNLHRRREGNVIVVGVISIGARAGRAVVVVNIAAIAAITIASTVIDVAMVPRPSKSPIRAGVPAG
eukprot:3798301-Pyramimonas_sp.AAC.1